MRTTAKELADLVTSVGAMIVQDGVIEPPSQLSVATTPTDETFACIHGIDRISVAHAIRDIARQDGYGAEAHCSATTGRWYVVIEDDEESGDIGPFIDH